MLVLRAFLFYNGVKEKARESGRRMAGKTEKLSKDVILKAYWADNYRFADLFNAVFFGGEQVLRPETLEEADTASEEIVSLKHVTMTVSRMRDVIKKQTHGMRFVLYAVENQMKVHYAMPLRVRFSEDLTYIKQCESLKREHKRKGGKMTPEEYLSGMKKGDRLLPVLTIVLYYGEDEWDGPVSLSEMMELPEFAKPLFQDYTMTLLQVRKKNHYPFKSREVRMFFDIVREFCSSIEWEKVQEKYKDEKLDRETWMAVGAVCGSRELIELTRQEKGDIEMVKGLRMLYDEGRAEERRHIALLMLKKSYDEKEIIDISQITKEELEELKRNNL